MRHAGTASWRFAEGIEQLPVAALYVRDAVELAMPAGGLIPPRLDAAVPDRSDLLDAAQRAAAGVEWAGWWHAVLAEDVGDHRGPPDGVEQHAWMRQRMLDTRTLFDPPEFESLADRPALRAAVSGSFPEAPRWADQLRGTLLRAASGRPAQFDYQLVRAAAEQTARQHRVQPGMVSACAVVLPVVGHWWQRYAPGAIVCSVHAAHDPDVARDALTDAFTSGLFS